MEHLLMVRSHWRPYKFVTTDIESVAEVETVTYRYVTDAAANCTTLNWSDGVGENTVNVGDPPQQVTMLIRQCGN